MRASTAVAFVVVGLCGSTCTRDAGIPAREPAAGSVLTIAAPPAERVQRGEAKRGVGWYPSLAVDDEDRVHVAWTDADLGDVLYAVSPPGALAIGTPEVVEAQGAAGAFVRLALAPGGAPVISYYHQGDHTLRVAHRPSDVAAMKAAGADVDTEPAPKSAAREGGPGWLLEDLAFGDDAGAGSALAVDKHGRVHLAYYVRGDRLRYARRPADVPAFGAGGVGHWEKIDVDNDAGQSPSLLTDLVVLDDGTVVISYADWQAGSANLKLAVRPPGQVELTVVGALDEPVLGNDGSWSALFTRGDGKLDVAAVRQDKRALLVGVLDPKAPAALTDRGRVVTAHGPAALARADNGTTYCLERDGTEDAAGIFLIEVPPGGTDVRRVLLERLRSGPMTSDKPSDAPWLSVAVRKDGRPVAAWFSDEAKALKIYSP